tara:strand:- start:200 stop:724 length:525 start_codon:yes stop_codon:yes gene_type:complete
MIIVTKITLNKWLNIKNKYTNIQIKDIIDLLFNYLYYHITQNKEFKLLTDMETFYNNFTEFIYNEHVYPIKKMNYNFQPQLLNKQDKQDKSDYLENEEFLFDYFNCKYSEDIVNIFLHFKDITHNYNFDLFHNKNDTSYPLLEFIFYSCHTIDPYIDGESEILEETLYYDKIKI